MKQRDFTNLETFILRCQEAIRQDGDGATVLFGNTRRRQQEWLMFCPAGPRARIIGWDAEAGLTVCEIEATQALERIAEGWFFDSLNPTFNARQHLSLSEVPPRQTSPCVCGGTGRVLIDDDAEVHCPHCPGHSNVAQDTDEPAQAQAGAGSEGQGEGA